MSFKKKFSLGFSAGWRKGVAFFSEKRNICKGMEKTMVRQCETREPVLFKILLFQVLWTLLTGIAFSAFWLRSKCSNLFLISLISDTSPHWGTSILNWFLNTGEMSGACSALATGWPGIAVPPGSAHSPPGEKYSSKRRVFKNKS